MKTALTFTIVLVPNKGAAFAALVSNRNLVSCRTKSWVLFFIEEGIILLHFLLIHQNRNVTGWGCLSYLSFQ